ncbi:unnamed protein product [Ostreobium quekettii]|uniref:Transmembrane 9 superfamily member n=1 Tax=Ostreobium quekettii TaxID=121088 RepID=A0A8S1IWS0_9CHLO|nr:unnamed protein product [Ostreobium quekettii]|eukprot:evm.model.scf_16.9 EVM.evm.TU.scf_16.9   scf_16:116914-124027(+)
MAPGVRVALAAALWIVLLGPAAGDERTHQYKIGEPVILWVNKIGPYNNPQETYNYFYLPFCRPVPKSGKERNWGNLGEVLEGNELVNSGLAIKFRENITKTEFCSQPLDGNQAERLQRAVRDRYWYEMFVDELPMWGFVGEARRSPESGKSQEQIYLHKDFRIGYNKDRIIEVALGCNDLVPLQPGVDLHFTYSVSWVETDVPFTRRFERYLDQGFFEHKIHWFSILNSFLMVVFLIGVVAMILLRTLRKDYAKYTLDLNDMDSLEQEISEESGWKLVHGDVFRPPPRLPLLSALVGTGVQLSVLFFFVLLITIAGTLFESRGTILTSLIACYTITSLIGGYTSGGFYARHGGTAWIRTMVLTACLFPGALFLIAFVLNTIAIAYHSLSAVPFGSIVLVLLLWAGISLPLCLAGTVLGRNWAGIPSTPCRVKRIPSAIPCKPWHLTPPAIILASGLLPFGSIFIELYFILTSFWNYKVYYVYGFMLLVWTMLLIATVCVSVVGTYVLLNAENYHWQWTAFLASASTAAYVFGYSAYYFIYRTTMTGLLQTCFYYGYTLMVCLGLGVSCGAVGYFAASTFVRQIYRNIKCD